MIKCFKSFNNYNNDLLYEICLLVLLLRASVSLI